MIVKDEAPVIRRCLESVFPLIDSWVIVDTGSTDGTQELIREILASIPGELHERPWVDFSHNRNEALRLAQGHGDYLLFIDGDEIIEVPAGFVMPPLVADAYWILVRYGACTYPRKQLVRNSGIWRYEGVLHEFVTSDVPVIEGYLKELVTVPRHDGARARNPLTYRRDALLLEKALLDSPAHSRYQFYLAQSYRDAKDPELALRHYQKRATMGGWIEEVWYSLYQIAMMKERLDKPWPEIMEAYLAAYQCQPDRAEPLYRIATHYHLKKEFGVAHLFLSRAAAIPDPDFTRLFVERPVYSWMIALDLAVTAHYARDYKTAIATANAVLRNADVPAAAIDQVIANRRYSIDSAIRAAVGENREPGRVRVLFSFRDPGPELDDCVASLLEQQCDAWEAVVIDDGSATDHASRIPSGDPRFTFLRHEPARGAAACIAEHLSQCADRDLIVLPLTAAERLADRGALGRIRDAFADSACALVYGQYRGAGGALGTAEPATCEDDFRARGSDLASGAPAAFRLALWDNAEESLWQRAGWNGTRFLDAVLTVRSAPPTRRDEPRAITMREEPLISCLMVTLDRLPLAKRAIRCFADQTWSNRELVIVTDGEPRYREALERFVSASNIENVRFVVSGERRCLGALRNLSLAQSRGEIICQWDDDDASHPNRLRMQAGHMLEGGDRASFLGDHLQWISDERSLGWIDWSLGGQRGPDALFPGSLMMFRDARFLYPEDGPHATQGEDSVFMNRVFDEVSVAALRGAGHLYLYEYHGRNTFGREHHMGIGLYRKPAAEIVPAAETLQAAIAYYALSRPATFYAREGPLFAVR